MKRCFVALAVPDATASALVRAQEALAGAFEAEARARFVPRTNLHLTLKFLGDVADAGIAPLQNALAALGARRPPLQAEAAGLATFTKGARATSVYADVSVGREAVVDLMADVEAALAPLGHGSRHLARMPHVTLVRFGRVGPAATSGAPFAAMPGMPAHTRYGPLDGTQMVLFESFLSAAGSTYVPLFAVPLAASAARSAP